MLLFVIEMRYHTDDMRKFFRYLLWILIVAVPLQGGAVAFNSYGMATRTGYTLASEAKGVETQKATPQADHCEHDAGAAVAEQGSKAVSNTHGVTHSKCGACASCSVGACAPPLVHKALMPRFLSTFVDIAAEPSITGFIPPTLERPPRHLC
jgi:hypothetical protein